VQREISDADGCHPATIGEEDHVLRRPAAGPMAHGPIGGAIGEALKHRGKADLDGGQVSHLPCRSQISDLQNASHDVAWVSQRK